MDLVERIMHLLRYPVIHFREPTIASIETVTLKLLLHVHGQALFDVGGHVMAVGAVTITHREEMQAQLLEHVRHEYVRVLILLVWVARLVTDGRGESEFGNAVEALCRRLHALAPRHNARLLLRVRLTLLLLLAFELIFGAWSTLATLIASLLLISLERLIMLRRCFLGRCLLLSQRL